MKRLPNVLFSCALIFNLATPFASANEAFHRDDANLYNSKKFALVRFDTNAKITDKGSGKTRFIDIEGNLWST